MADNSIQTANSLYRNGELESAQQLYEQIVNHARKNNLKEDLAISLGGLGNICADLKHFDEAESYYKEALKLNLELDRKQGVAKQ